MPDTQQNKAKPGLLFVQVVQGDKVLYEDDASTVSSRNSRGRFDILPQHTNYISLIKEFVSIYNLQGKEKQITIKNGIMRVYEDVVEIFLGFDS